MHKCTADMQLGIDPKLQPAHTHSQALGVIYPHMQSWPPDTNWASPRSCRGHPYDISRFITMSMQLILSGQRDELARRINRKPGIREGGARKERLQVRDAVLARALLQRPVRHPAR